MTRFHLFTLIFSMFLSATYAQSSMGIDFKELSFTEALEQAKEQDKIIFIDAYAVWCGPCKQMDKNVFSLTEVGKVYNDKFINLKIDMEKGEGVELASRFGVRAYPTFLFVDGTGDVVHRSIGYQQAPQFIELAGVASDPSKQLGAKSRKYEEGNRDPEFLMEYVDDLMDVMDPKANEVIEAYLETQESWDNEPSMSLIMKSVNQADGKLYDYMIANHQAFIEQFGADAYEQKVYGSAMRTMMANDDLNVASAARIFDKAYQEASEKLQYQFKVDYHFRNGEHEEFANAAIALHETYPIENAMQLNQYAWHFYENIDDKKLLKKGLGLAQASVGIWRMYENLDTLAALYYKLGKKKKAKKAAAEAIEMAEKMGIDPKDTKDLLAKMNKKKK